MTINGLITSGRKKEEEMPQNTYENFSKYDMRIHFLKIAPKKAVKEGMLQTLQVYYLQNIYLESTLQEEILH